MTRQHANVILMVVLVWLLWPAPPQSPPVPQPPQVAGLGAVTVDLPDDYVRAFADLVTNRGFTASGWSISLADDCAFYIKGDTMVINGGIRVSGHAMRIPIHTSVASIKVQPGRLVVDLNGIPLDVVIK